MYLNRSSPFDLSRRFETLNIAKVVIRAVDSNSQNKLISEKNKILILPFCSPWFDFVEF
jgi:hypothetical protein